MEAALWLPDALKLEGVPFELVDGWDTRGARSKSTGKHYPFDPFGVLNHHDAINESVPADQVLDIMIDGRPDLRGPLCNLWLDDDGLCYVVAAGNANHAGGGSGIVLARVQSDQAPLGDARDLRLADDVIGNPHLIGLEVNGADGVLTPKQQDTQVRINAGICRFKGWSANRCIHHREFTKRKPDMAWRGPLRQLVTDRLTHIDTTRLEDDMPLGKNPDDDRRSAIRGWCWTYWGRGPVANEQDILLYHFVQKGSDLTHAHIADHPHAKARRAA